MTTAASPAARGAAGAEAPAGDSSAGQIDVVVVYKVDRLTRSLTDFAKIVELFDSTSVTFVSVTQQFNTTTSMGRLTLNVLLSFAQFEREVTGERIRDKIAASKRKGMWMGGHPPLGYDVKDRKLGINQAEAAPVRGLRALPGARRCARIERGPRSSGIVSAVKLSSKGKQRGGKPFSRGALYALLNNRLYLSEIANSRSLSRQA